MFQTLSIQRIVALGTFAGMLAGCGEAQQRPPRSAANPPPGLPSDASASAGQRTDATMQPTPVERAPLNDVTVHFEFDSSDVDARGRDALAAVAAGLRDEAGARLRIEGHCDERGTTEYNLALGERRAYAARDYLRSLGVDVGRMRTQSYGEEQPADPGHDESAWAHNRRAEIKIQR